MGKFDRSFKIGLDEIMLNTLLEGKVSAHYPPEEFKLIEHLEGPAVAMLLYLKDNEKGRFTDFAETLSCSHSTTEKAINQLKFADLITDTKVKKERIIAITEKGRWVAKKLKEIDDFLETNKLRAPESTV